jgi:hypothetical protein
MGKEKEKEDLKEWVEQKVIFFHSHHMASIMQELNILSRSMSDYRRGLG